MATSPARSTTDVHYSDSDGKPMGETGIHVNATLELFWTIKKVVFGRRPDVYVAADMFFCYEQGNPRAVEAPDIMVIKGVAHPEERRSFKLWVEGRLPSLVFEFTSKKTRREDTEVKLELYARLGIAEYFLFDPLGEYLNPRLRGYRLGVEQYEPIAPEVEGGFASIELDLIIRAVGNRVRLFDPVSGRVLPDFNDQAREGREQQAIQRGLAEATRARKTMERRAKRATRNYEAERQRAEVLAEEIARLRALPGEKADETPPDRES